VRRPFTITKLERHEDGYWAARVTLGGLTLEVDRKWGSWQARVPERLRDGTRVVRRRGVLPHVAAELQARVRAAERRERVAA
jgi:hypothetical protein